MGDKHSRPKAPDETNGRVCFNCGIPMRCQIQYSRLFGPMKQTLLIVWSCPECEEMSYEVAPGP